MTKNRETHGRTVRVGRSEDLTSHLEISMEISLTAQQAAHQPAATRAVTHITAVFYTEAMQKIFHL